MKKPKKSDSENAYKTKLEGINIKEWLRASGVKKINEFKPGGLYIAALDMYLYLVEDVSYTSRPILGTCLSVLYSNTDPERVIGFKVDYFSRSFERSDILGLTERV
jgi:hypothetical protein